MKHVAALSPAAILTDTSVVDAARRDEILTRYADQVQRFNELAMRRGRAAEIIPLHKQPPEPPVELTARELDVLRLIAEGLTNEEISGRLFLSTETVKVHVRNLLARLRARSRAHAVAIALRRGSIH